MGDGGRSLLAREASPGSCGSPPVVPLMGGQGPVDGTKNGGITVIPGWRPPPTLAPLVNHSKRVCSASFAETPRSSCKAYRWMR